MYSVHCTLCVQCCVHLKSETIECIFNFINLTDKSIKIHVGFIVGQIISCMYTYILCQMCVLNRSYTIVLQYVSYTHMQFFTERSVNYLNFRVERENRTLTQMISLLLSLIFRYVCVQYGVCFKAYTLQTSIYFANTHGPSSHR